MVIDIDETQRDNLATYFGINSAQYVFYDEYMKKLPFYISKSSGTKYDIYTRVLTTTSQLTIDGTFNLFNTAKDGVNYPTTPASSKVGGNWVYTDGFASSSYSTIKYTGVDVAHIEASHKTLQANFFQNFVGTSSLSQVNNFEVIIQQVETTTDFPVGSYWIVSDAFETIDVENKTSLGYCQVGDVLFVDETVAPESTPSGLIIRRAVVKKFLSSTNNSSVLSTNLTQGDLYINDTGLTPADFFMYDSKYIAGTDPNPDYFRDVVELATPASPADPTGYSVDATQLLPMELTNNHIVRIVYSGVDTQVNYPYSSHDKIGDIYRLVGGVWVADIGNRVVDGDVLLYRKNPQTPTPVWNLLENLERDPSDYTRIDSTGAAEETADLNGLDVTFLKIYKVTAQITISSTIEHDMFVNEPSDGIIYPDNYIICIDTTISAQYPNGIWKLFDNDVFEYHIDVETEQSKFPILMYPGNVFTVYDTGNFNGQTGLVTYVPNEEILYIGDNQWKKFNTSGVVNYGDRVDSKVGDLIVVSDSTGDFGSDLTKLDCPIYTPTGKMLFSKYDMLYYNGTYWVKVYPFNAYNDISPNSRLLINGIGLNSDFHIAQKEIDKFTTYMYDQFHKQIIGVFDYFTGKLTLSIKVDKLTADEATPVEVSITEVFKRENYANNARQMDVVTMKPSDVIFGSKNDFDTNFNQYIIADVKNTIII